MFWWFFETVQDVFKQDQGQGADKELNQKLQQLQRQNYVDINSQENAQLLDLIYKPQDQEPQQEQTQSESNAVQTPSAVNAQQ